MNRRPAAAMLALALAIVPGARASGLPDYPTESTLLVDTPGTTLSVVGGLFNPAAWPIQRQGGLFFGWNDGAGNPARDDLTAIASLRGLAFGMRQFRVEPAPGDELRIRDYTLGTGVGTRSAALGVSYAWGGGDLDRVARHERFAIGSVHRSRRTAFGLSWTRDLEVDDNFLQADLGLRPWGPRLTLFGDAVLEQGEGWEDIRSGYGVELRPMAGLALAAKARSTGEVSLRVNVALGRHSDWSFRPHLDDDAERTAATYAVEFGGPWAGIGHGRWGVGYRYPQLALKGRLPYQRYRLFDSRRSFLDVLRRIQEVADDPAAGGIVIDLSGAEAGGEMMWEIREQLAGLRARGKKVVVYVDRAGMFGMMLASVADRIFMDPLGALDLRGLATGRTYMRRALDKMGVGVDEWRFFTYKSAFEGYSRESMSDPDREQRQALIDDFYEEVANAVTVSRGISRAAWDSLVNTHGVFLPEDALAAGLVDEIGGFEQARRAAPRLGLRARADASMAVLSGVAGDPVWSPLEWGESPRIAVLYAIGPCEMDTGIRGRKLAAEIRKARERRDVAAIVLRADSPGGDALPSDLVSRELREAAKRKPVIVSQGQVAASGGYWISMFGDSILASPLTITGSIGVIGGWFWNKELGNKIGFDYDGVKRGEHADADQGIRLPFVNEVVPDRPLTDDERQKIERLVRTSYEGFVDKVASGRGLDAKQVDAIGQGRVWSGTRGRKNGLVDELGGLWRSLQMAKAAAGLQPGEDVVLEEGPTPGLFDASKLRPRLFGSDGDAESAALALPGGEPPLDPEELDFLRALLRARGQPVYRMEPLRIEDGSR